MAVEMSEDSFGDDQQQRIEEITEEIIRSRTTSACIEQQQQPLSVQAALSHAAASLISASEECSCVVDEPLISASGATIPIRTVQDLWKTEQLYQRDVDESVGVDKSAKSPLAPPRTQLAKPTSSEWNPAQTVPVPRSPSHPSSWEQTLNHSVHGIVSLRCLQTRPFDTEQVGSYLASGFIVDLKRCLILSNRHVCGSGPIRARAVFMNDEEVPVRCLYRDPVHDFGFFQFRREDVKFMRLSEIVLNPDGAKVGTDIRVVGNDAGEKLSILQGTLSRLDRHSPVYGPGCYNDINTFYYQAASSTSGGSSGSPVLNRAGECIALNAGASSQTSQSYYLPLHGVQRTLKHLQRAIDFQNQDERPVLGFDAQPPSDFLMPPRGTLHVEWEWVSLDKARWMGLTTDQEQWLRAHGATGILMIHHVTPEGVADGLLESGDLLISAHSQYITSQQTSTMMALRFDTLEQFLDEHVHQAIHLTVQRNGKIHSIQVPRVASAHDDLATEFLEIGDGIIHRLSECQARSYHHPKNHLYIAFSGYSFANSGIPSKSVLYAVNGVTVHTIDDFLRVVSDIVMAGRHSNIRIEHALLGQTKKRITVWNAIRISRFYPVLIGRRESLGEWTVTTAKIGTDSPQTSQEFRSVFELARSVVQVPRPPLTVIERIDKLLQIMQRSTVNLRTHLPYLIEGAGNSLYEGQGCVLLPHLILTHREAVPISTCQIEISAGDNQVDGQVIWMHPFHNVVLLTFGKNCRGADRSAIESLNARALLLHVQYRHLVDSSKAVNSPFLHDLKMHPLNWYLVTPKDIHNMSGKGGNGSGSRLKHYTTPTEVPPRFHTMQMDCLMNPCQIPQEGLIVATNNGFTVDFLAIHCRSEHNWLGIPLLYLKPWLMRFFPQVTSASDLSFNSGCNLKVPYLDIDVTPISLVNARQLELSSTWMDQFKPSGICLQVNSVSSFHGSDVKEGDLILTVNSTLIRSSLDLLQLACQPSPTNDFMWELELWRNGSYRKVWHRPSLVDTNSKKPLLVGWGGAIFQLPYHAVMEQTKSVSRCGSYQAIKIPYLTCVTKGSPVEWAGLTSGYFVTAVDDVSIDFDFNACADGGCPLHGCEEINQGLHHLVHIIKNIGTGTFVRLDCYHRNGRKKVIALCADREYWPCWVSTQEKVFYF